MSEFASLITRRGQLKGTLTRFYNYVQIESPDPIQIKIRKEKLEDTWNEYQQVQSEIDVETDVNIDEQTQYRFDFEELYYKAIALAIKRESIAKATGIPENSEQNINKGGEDALNNFAKDFKCRLPQLNVPTFSGDYHEWPEFSEMFTSLVHNRKDLSDIEKFLYLRSSLKDDALRSIQCLDTTSSNYEEARKTLFKRYANTKVRTQSHVKAIFDLEPITIDSASKLRQFTDSLTGHTRALETLGYQPNSWGPMLVHLVCSKLDRATLKEWETKSSKEEVAPVLDLLTFLEERYKILEAVESSRSINTRNTPKPFNQLQMKKFPARSSVLTSTTELKCNFCGSSHSIYHCESFLALPVPDRIKRVKERKLCINCLRSHAQKRCTARNCFKCAKPHNTLLHLPVRRKSTEKTLGYENKSDNAITTESPQGNPTSSTSNHVSTYTNKTVLLPTAVALIKNKSGELIRCRILLDSGSQSNFLSERMVQVLRLPKQALKHKVFGIGGAAQNVSASITATIKSRFSEFKITLSCLVVKRITNYIPSTFGIKPCSIPDNINLADPLFTEPQRIDMLIGAEHFYDLLDKGQIKIDETGPTFQETKLGWIASGQIVDDKFVCNKSSTFVSYSNTAETDGSALESLISSFWRLEEYGSKAAYTIEEKACKNNFDKTIQRGDDGRFIVHLPFRDNASNLGNSYAIALKRFLSLERRLQGNEQLKSEYCKFMCEYEQLGHMEKVEENELKTNNWKICYLPHHAVVNEQKTSTKVRVVFDASCKTETGLSLNDVLLKGPAIQDDLIYILSRFRTYNYVLVGDIIKMYRQMWVLKKHCDVQRILWRPDPKLPIQTYRLKTITYGTVPASFLATACLQKLSESEFNRYPRACNAIIDCFYVDDLLCGAETREGLVELRDELIAVMSSAGLQLSKWVSNDRQVIAGLSSNESDNDGHTFDTAVTKILGLRWDSTADSFRYTVDNMNMNKQITKRSILSDVAKLFDPIGLLSPVIINAKLIMQHLWQVKVDWDDPVPKDIETEWRNYTENLPVINNIAIPRKLFSSNKIIDCQIHGFADSSIRAYGAVLYMRSTDENGEHSVRVICAKSKVAPIKTVSLPRLELCAALLLARLSHKIVPKLKVTLSKIFYWTDSSIVLAWISSPSAKWKTFVAHRVGEIQELTAVSDWFHVGTHENPADVISRGCAPSELLSSSSLYWCGPDWLKTSSEFWPALSKQIIYDNLSQLPEAKIAETHSNLCTTSIEFNSFARCSSYRTVIRAIAYCFRFAENTLSKKRNTTHLTVSEIDKANIAIIKIIQRQHFSEELSYLKRELSVPPKGKLFRLRPFLDGNGLIRVGGRLKNATTLDVFQRNPIVLPHNNLYTKRLFEYEHRLLGHGGPQAVLTSIRSRYWPIGGRNIARTVAHSCVICFRYKPIAVQPIMGSLPHDRVEPSRAFLKSGIDFAGPIMIKSSSLRKAKSVKGYICIFVCFVTKAVHIEVVSDLTTKAFLNALNRFFDRRGRSAVLYTDNATNFVGAQKRLEEIFRLWHSEEHTHEVKKKLTDEGVEWRFIPPRSPHFGGLWEAAVKAMKSLLYKILGNSHLTYEELSTVLTRVEACLNSRPITPLSTDPTDLYPLTPAHFIIGDSLLAVPERVEPTTAINYIDRWRRVTQLSYDLWKRWSREYLNQLQERVKWNRERGPAIEVGTVVLIHEDNLPPLEWRIGQVCDVHTGIDGVIRVASVRASNGEVYKRAVRKLCPLPIEDNIILKKIS